MSAAVRWIIAATARMRGWADRLEAYNARRRLEDASRLRCPKRPLPWHRRAVAYALAHAILCGTAGFEVSTLWRWFARPLGAPPLGFWHAIGLTMLAATVTFTPREPSTLGEVVTGRVQRAAVRLAIGAVVLWAWRS